MATFLEGTGEIGHLIAAHDWSSTQLGPIGQWPPHLRVVLAMMLRSPAPMALMWGPDGILLYNQGYAAVAAQRHPHILGRPALEAWPEAADLNRRVLQTCLSGGALSLKEQRLTLCRRGAAEDVWLDLAYGPVPDSDGKPDGVLAVLTETTARTLADERLRIAQEAGQIGTFEWFPETQQLTVSDVYRGIYGFAPGEEVTEAGLLALVPAEDLSVTGHHLHRSGKPGNPLAYAEYRIRHKATGALRWVARRGEIMPGGSGGTAQRFIGVAWDITERKTAELQEAFLAALSDRLRDLADAHAVVATACDMLGRHLLVGRAGYGDIDATGTYATIESDWTDGAMPSIAGRHRIALFGSEIVDALWRGQTVPIDDVAEDARVCDPDTAAAFGHIGTRAALTMPLIRDGRFAGVLFVHSAVPRHWTDADSALIGRVATRIWDAAQRARAEQNLRDSEENFRLLAEAMPNLAWAADASGTIDWSNDQSYVYTGETTETVRAQDWPSLLHPDDRDAAHESWQHAVRDGENYETEYRLRRADGTYRWHIVRALPIRGADGRVRRWIGTSTDIEEQRRALAELVQLNATLEDRVEDRTRELRQTEAALRQAQKMEAIGQLTGGIAHDFNNLLTGIIGGLGMVRRRLGNIVLPDDPRRGELDPFIEAASGSAQRAASLTHRLLAFARRQSLDTKPVDTAALVHGMAELLQRTLGEQVRLSISAAACWPALTDANQLESAILNLAINARDAMPHGGVLTILAAGVTLGADEAARTGPLEPGDYVAISVSDTGTGMNPDMIEKVFEPFFTTKPVGQGTGLGLSMVYGFTRQSGGHAHIESAPGEGTTVTLYLPRAALPADAAADAAHAAPRGAGQTVLVVEDVPDVRMLIVEVLNELGYRAIEAADSAGALPVISSSQRIDLLVTDVGLPGLNGRQIADFARERRPSLKVLFVTGYAEDAAIRGGFLDAGMAIITKPFAVERLAEKISEMML